MDVKQVEKSKQKRAFVVRTVCFLMGLLLAASGIAPYTFGAVEIHVGSVALLLLGAAIMLIFGYWGKFVRLVQRLWRPLGGKIVLTVLSVLIIAGVGVFTFVSAQMICAASAEAPENATVIVPGAGIRGDRPSRTLADRLKMAAAYLNEHPSAVCIVTGGQSDDEICSEASVMKTYLLELGIEESRILVEDRSLSTSENMRNAKQMMEEYGLGTSAVIATQEYHQLRAQAFARDVGMDPVGACTCRSDVFLLPGYWVREIAGNCYRAVFGK